MRSTVITKLRPFVRMNSPRSVFQRVGDNMSCRCERHSSASNVFVDGLAVNLNGDACLRRLSISTPVGRRIESISLLVRFFSLQCDRLQKLRNDYLNVAIYGFDLPFQALRSSSDCCCHSTGKRHVPIADRSNRSKGLSRVDTTPPMRIFSATNGVRRQFVLRRLPEVLERGPA